MTKKIYLIRHGQTDYNLKGIVQGRGVDAHLNDTGKQQAALFFEKYRDIPFKKIYTSSLRRTIQSVQSFIELGIPYESYEGLDEISWGHNDGKIASNADQQFYWGMLEAWSSGRLDARIEGGESPLDVQQRQKPIVDLILSRPDEDVILVCMHGRAIRILLATILNYDLKKMDEFEHHNLGLYVLNYMDKSFSIEIHNDINHLRAI